ncbi:cytochrome c oxidase subunit 3, partial [Escherichia coli]|nr:cytochrome c oxidase subunit 3 [Escherichia coli]
PAQSSWPIIGAFALFLVAVGAGMTVQGTQSDGAVGVVGRIVLAVGFLFLLYMLAGWFSNVITESLTGKYNAQITRSFRQGMSWFIFSEVMF